jgi:hypothetical protein
VGKKKRFTTTGAYDPCILPPMPGVFPDYPTPVVRNAAGERELITMRLGHATSATRRRFSRHQHPQHHVAALARLVEAGKPLPGPGKQFCGVCAGAEPGDQEEGRRLVRAQ